MTPGLASYSGACWRAVAAGCEDAVLDGTDRAGRYNRPGDRALYMSGSPEGVAAAMRRYGPADRTLVALTASAERLVDLRDRELCLALGIDPGSVGEDWIAAIDRGREPPSWAVADRAHAVGATGLIDASRGAPGQWHLVLFAWNHPGGATVEIA